jgi:hypothetical protein
VFGKKCAVSIEPLDQRQGMMLFHDPIKAVAGFKSPAHCMFGARLFVDEAMIECAGKTLWRFFNAVC